MKLLPFFNQNGGYIMFKRHSDFINNELSGILPDGIFAVTNESEMERIIEFKKSYCSDDRPGVSEFHFDGFESNSVILFGVDDNENITSTMRVLFDSTKGFPEEDRMPESFNAMRKNGKKFAEIGRLVITSHQRKLLRKYYKAAYDIAMVLEYDYLFWVMKKSNLPSHEKLMHTEVLSENMGHSWDQEQAELCLVIWDIHEHQPAFHKWIAKENISKFDKWDNYSPYHLGVLTSVQHEVYTAVSQKLSGNVADLGCGSGRIMGYIQNNPNVISYTGIDASTEMIKQATWLKEKLSFTKANLINNRIENMKGTFDSIFTIHSFYTWPDQMKTLDSIRNLLADKGRLIIVTPSNKFDTKKLSEMVNREILGHPYHDDFLKINYDIASNHQYASLDDVIGQVRNSGFKVVAAHGKYFLGGASYLELEKAS